MAALIFVRVESGTALSPEEKKTLEGSYFVFGENVGIQHTNFKLSDNVFQLYGTFDFYSEKFTDIDTLKKFNGAKYYFKSADTSNLKRILVVSADDSLKQYRNDQNDSLSFIYYKISPDQNIRLSNTFEEEEKDAIKSYFKSENFEELPEMINKHIMKTSISNKNILKPYKEDRRNDNTGKQTNEILQFFIFGSLIVFVIVVFFVCFCGAGKNSNTPEELQFNEARKNDHSNHYPSPTDLVIDVKYIETVESTKSNTNQSTSITNATIEYVLTSESTHTEEQESTTAQSSSIFTSTDTAEVKTISATLSLFDSSDSQSELAVKKTDDLSSKLDDENENTTDMSIDDNDDCRI
jgi:hypothetical protein